MDSQTPKMPEITVEARDEQKEKKRSGLLGFLDLFGKGGGGFSGALGGAGAGGGLLATKAGIIALILVGSTLAGGIGVVGYKAFGPGSSSGDGRFSSIFAQKTKEQIAAEAEAEAKAAAAANGGSSSLSDLAKANAGALNGPQPPAAADAANPTDKTKQDASAIADAAKAAAAAKGKDNNTNIGGNKAASLKSDKKIGELSKLGGGAGGGGGSGASFSTASGQKPQNGKLGAFGAGASPNMIKAGGASRARKFGGAVGQALAANRDGLGNKTSMQGAGATFDGNGAGAPIGGPSVPLGGAGATGSGASPTAPTSSPGIGGEGNRFAQPPPAGATNVTPWQAALNTAMMLVAAAALLLYAIKTVGKMQPYGTAAAYIMAGIAAAIGAYVIYLGSLIGGSFYGQQMQGNMMEVAGTFITITAAQALMNMDQTIKDGPSGLMMISGAAALGATAMAYLSPMKSYPSTDFKNGFPPDYDYHATDNHGRSN